MKIFPLDIDSIYHNMPDKSLEYYTFRSAAIIGGICKTSQDILEKILLANSFLDTFEQIFLVGEIGLAALYALDINPGLVERSTQSYKEYETMKEFFLKLFNKSVEKGVKIHLPLDIVCSEKASFDEIMNDAANKAKSGGGLGGGEGGADGPGKSGEQQTGSKKSIAQQEQANLEISEIQKVQSDKEIGGPGEGKSKAVAFETTFKPNHWTDAQIFYGKASTYDLEASLRRNFDKVTEETRKNMNAKKVNKVLSSANNLMIAE